MFTLVLALSLAASPEVALLSSRGDVAELRFQPLGALELTEPVARFSHGEGSDVRGSLLPRTGAMVPQQDSPKYRPAKAKVPVGRNALVSRRTARCTTSALAGRYLDQALKMLTPDDKEAKR